MPLSISPINDRNPACYGIGCARHGECNRYAAVEQTTWEHTIGTCDDGAGRRPMFVPVAVQAGAPAAEVQAC